MELWKAGLLFAVGGLAGFINVMAGGGSLLTMPALVFMGMPGPVANGTNRIAILLQNVSAVSSFFKRGFSDFRLSLTLTLCALPGTLLGAWLGTHLTGDWFNRVLAAVMVVVMILMARGTTRKEDANNNETVSHKRTVIAHLLMVIAGLYGGFIQAGVGFIMMAILHRVLRLDLVRVNMHKVFIVGVYTLFALAVFAWNGQVRWMEGLILAAGNMTGGWISAGFAVEKGEKPIRILLNILLVILALKLLFFS